MPRGALRWSDAAAGLASALGPWECIGPWIGAKRLGSSAAIDQGWTDPEGLPLPIQAWASGQPTGAHVLNWTAAFSAPNGVPERWTNVFGDPDAGPEVMGYVLKLPADAPDCDNDGTPDVVDIVVFGSPDDNSDGIPDSCPTLPDDFNNDGKVDGHEVPHHNEPPHVGNPKA